MTGKSSVNDLMAGLSAMVSRGLENLFGPAVNRPVFDSITRADLGVTSCLILLVLLVNVLVAVYLRIKIKSAVSTESGQMRYRVLRTLGKPLYLLIWIYGGYVAVTPLLLRFPRDEGMRAVRAFFTNLFDLGAFTTFFWLFFRFTHMLEARVAIFAEKAESRLAVLFLPLMGRSLRIIVPVIGIIFALPLLNLPNEYAGIIAKATSILLIVAVAIILFQAVHLGETAILTKYDIKAADNLLARKIYTQVHFISKSLYVVVGFFTVASILMLFEEIRRFGTSLLASAGVVGIIIGFAAQKTIANLFAGFQLAMTQPIRLDDVVIVEGEWGRIEEITLTYVVVHIWDDRRLVVPLSYFIEKPFQNWTRASAELLGSVFLWVDYSLPLEDIRRVLKDIIEPNPLWDKRFWNMQVTDTTERSMQIRVLATSADSSTAWNLRCDIREKLISYIQKNHPQSLPRLRTELHSAAGKEEAGNWR